MLGHEAGRFVSAVSLRSLGLGSHAVSLSLVIPAVHDAVQFWLCKSTNDDDDCPERRTRTTSALGPVSARPCSLEKTSMPMTGGLALQRADQCFGPSRAYTMGELSMRALHTGKESHSTGVVHAHSPVLKTDAQHLKIYAARAQARLKGVTRKIILRTLNKRIIAQVARRATIGIPCLGFYFVSRLMFKDYARVRKEASASNTLVAALFSLALCCDLVDLAAQAVVITGIAHSQFGVGFSTAAGWLAYADKYSLAMAFSSVTAGVTGEILTVLREEQEAEAIAAQTAVTTDEASADVSTKQSEQIHLQ